MFPNAEYDAEMLLTLQVTKALLVQSWEEQPKPQWMKLCGSKKEQPLDLWLPLLFHSASRALLDNKNRGSGIWVRGLSSHWLESPFLEA